jgi:hypothetical protein
MTSIHAVAFGDIQTLTWGVSWRPEDAAASRLAIRQGPAAGVHETALRADGDAQRLEGEGATLLLRPVAPAARGLVAGGELETVEQLCEASGEVRLDGRRSEVRCLGWRTTLTGAVDLSSVDSFRFLAGWLGPEHGFSLTALRPASARGHESDLSAAAVIDDPPLPPVLDPRLSTTYADSGLPARAGLELWFQEPDDAEPEESEAPQYPRRAAGEVIDSALEWSQGGFLLRASLLRWQSRGEEGPGVYLLGQRQ